MALIDTYHTKLQDFVALQKPDKPSCYHDLTMIHAQLFAEKTLELPPINPMAAGMIYDSQIVGVYYTENGKILASLPKFTELALNPDPQNPVDQYAVKVMYHEAHLGYLPQVVNKPIFSALTTGKEVICLLHRYVPAVERNNEFTPERAVISIHIIHPARFQQFFTNLMDIYALTYPNLPPNWVQSMTALGEVVVPMLENYLTFHPEISGQDVLVLIKSQFSSRSM
jgi:hypothetical protein